MAEPPKIDESDTNLSTKDNKETNVASTSKETDPKEEEDKKLVTFQCSHCFLFEKCRFGDLLFDKSGYTESVFYLRDPFVPPDFHKKDYAVQDFVVLGSLCYLCGQPVCIDEECSLFYVHTYCISCVSRERDRFPVKLIQSSILYVISAHLPKMPLIGTHSGKFHCDEVFACWMLKTLPEYSEHVVLRSRDPDVLKTCDILVDVGAVYDHNQLKYDHHQRSFNETMKTLGLLEFDTKLSSAGLIYAHYGKRVIGVLRNIPNGDPNLDILYKKMYENFVECCDAVDNGVPQFDGIPRYRLASTLTSRVNDLNPSWNEPEDSVNLDERFVQAMKLVGEEFTGKLKYYHESWLSARDLVKQAIDKRYEVDPSGKIILFENGGVPWEEDFFNIEKEEGLEKLDISYALLANNCGSWGVQSIPLNELQAFENRAPLPEPWRGHRDADLEAICGIPGSIFVHASGFLGGTKTREGALKMAIEALKILGRYKTT